MRRITPAGAIGLAMLLLFACEHTSTSPRLDGLALDVVSGNGQTAIVGTQLAPLIVKVTNSGNPVAGQVLNFRVLAGGGSVYGGTEITDGHGIAQELWTLGTKAADSQKVEVRAVESSTGAEKVFGVFTATAVADRADSLFAQSGDGQTATAGNAVAVPPTVKVSDKYGNPIEGVSITFAVTSGGGTATGLAQTSNVSGLARVGSWTLGSTAGSNTLSANSLDLNLHGSPVTFTAGGTTGNAARLVLLSGNNQTARPGDTVPQKPTVKVVDANGNGVPNVAVTFTVTGGGGSIAGVGSVTVLTSAGASGLQTGAAAVNWALGAGFGPNSLQATAEGLSGSPIVFNATGFIRIARIQVSPGGTTISSVNGTQQLTASPQDSLGRPVTSAVTWASLNPNVATVSSTGEVSAVATGQVTISATAGGVSGYGLVTVAIPGATPVNLWVPLNSPTGGGGNAVWGASSSDIFSVGLGYILHFDGTSWTVMPNPAGGLLRSVWGTSGTNVYAVGSQRILHYDGTSWTQVLSVSEDLFGVWGSSPSDIFADGYNGSIFHYDGSNWTLMTTATAVPLTGGFWGTSSTNLYAAGQGAILHYDGTSWQVAVSVPSVGFGRTWGTSALDIYNASNGQIWHFDGSTWSVMPSSPGGLGLWGSSSTDIYAVAQSSSIARYDGTSWTNMGTTGLGNDLYGVWGTSSSDVLAVANATLLRGVRGGSVTVTPVSPVLSGNGATQQLSATARDAQSNVLGGLINSNYTWTSRNTSVATVDASGLVTAAGAGTAVLVAVAPGGAADSTTVTVVAGCDCWASLAPMPTARTQFALGAIGGALYAATGCIDSSSCNAGPANVALVMYDTATNTWSSKASIPSASIDLAGTVAGGVFYTVGGDIPGGGPVPTLQAYDPGTNSWETRAPMPTPRSDPGAAAINGKVYVVGGGNQNGDLTTLEIYDPVANSWSVGAPMPTPRHMLATGVVNGVLYAVGGVNQSGVLSTLEMYDPATNTWTSRAPMPTPRMLVQAGVVDGVLYVTGGFNQSGGYLATVEAYNPSTNSWSTKAPMPTPRAYHRATTIGGRLYVVGGYNTTSGYLSSVEVYKP